MFKCEDVKQERIERLLFFMNKLETCEPFLIDEKEVCFTVSGCLVSNGHVVYYDFNRLVSDTKVRLREIVND